MDSVYFRVNHNSKFINFNTAIFAKIKSDLFYELSKRNESTINIHILKIFNNLLPQIKSKDKLFTIIALIEEYKKIKNPSVQSLIYISQNLINKKIKTSLNFTSENIEEFSILISLGFSKLFSTKKSKIKTYKNFLTELEKNKKFDIIQIYKKNNFSLPKKISGLTISPELLLLVAIMKNIKNINISLNDFNKNNLLSYLIIILNQEWLFPFVCDIKLDLTYEQLETQINDLIFQYEKKFYIYMLNNIINLNNNIEEEKNNNENNIINNENNILNNIQSLNLLKQHYKFYFNKNLNINPFEIKNEENNSTKTIPKIKLIPNNLFFNINNIANIINEIKVEKNNKNSSNEDKLDKIYINILKDNNKIYDIILSYFYFIKEFKYLKSLTIKMPNGFIKESIGFLKLKNFNDINPSLIYIFEYLSTLSELSNFNITFNSLEQRTFSNVIYMIQNNIELRELSLNLFPFDKKDKDLNSQNLIKLAQESGICSIFEKEKIIKQKLLKIFEINLEKLFILLLTRKNLEKLEISINLPSILNDNKGYYISILKFIINIFLLCNQDKHNLTELKLNLPFFNMDNIKNPIIAEIFKKININNKNKLLTKFYFNASLNHIQNISNIISYNLISLNIGQFDLPTFKSFIGFFESKEYLEKSKLKYLSIGLNNTIIKYKDCKSYIDILIQGNGHKNLEEITFKCYFKIKSKKLKELLDKVNGNRIKKYSFVINVKELNKYKKITNNNSYYYLNQKIVLQINKYIPIFKKLAFTGKDKMKIVKKINKCLMPSNRKIINIEKTFL